MKSRSPKKNHFDVSFSDLFQRPKRWALKSFVKGSDEPATRTDLINRIVSMMKIK